MQNTNFNHSVFKKRQFGKDLIYKAEIIFPENGNAALPVADFSIERDVSILCQSLNFELHNVAANNFKDSGYYSPDRAGTSWTGDIWPGKLVQLRVTVIAYSRDETGKPQEYSETFVLFTGWVEDVDMTVDDKSSKMKVYCRDKASRLIDESIPEDEYGDRWLEYAETDIGDIIRDLVLKAGFTEADILDIGKTGILVDEEFQDTTFANCIASLTEICGYEFFFDENGKAILRKPFTTTPTKTESFSFTETQDYHYLGFGNDSYSAIIPKSDSVTSADGSYKYFRDVDYIIDYIKKVVKRTSTSTIPIGEALKITFNYTAYHYREGEDLYLLNYKISKSQIYGTVKVQGDGVEATYTIPSTYYGVGQEKVLMAPRNVYLSTEDQCQKMANRLGYSMIRTFRRAEILGVGVPFLQFGDSLQITEHTTTISEVYRIAAISFIMQNGMLLTRARTYYYDHAPY